jgi:UDP-glucose:(heptosyl)LPS alpha-1,3-glucosyltransferase
MKAATVADPPKIAMAIENFSVSHGGAESYAVELARFLVSEGWEVHFFGHSWDHDPPEAVFHRIRRLPARLPASIKILDFALCHRRMVARMDFDVILGSGNTILMNVYQSHGGVHRLSNLRKLQAVGNQFLRFLKGAGLFLSPKYHARAWIESAPFRTAKRPIIIAISDMVRDDMADYFGRDRDGIRLVYNGIDVARFGARSAEKRAEVRQKLGFEDEILFLFMAYDFRKKGLRHMLEAAAELRGRVGPRRIGVVVVGGSPSPALSRFVRRLGIEDLVFFNGPTKVPEAFYSACDVFMLPTFYDACSLVVFEAMAAGLPVITTKNNGASGVITHGVDGAVLGNPWNIGEMADTMEMFLDKDLLQSASKAAERTAAHYTLKNNHSKMLEIFDEAARSG